MRRRRSMVRGRRGPSARSGVNDRLLGVLVGLAAVIPVPFGSNRPVLWAFWGAATGLTGIWWLWRISQADASFRMTPRSERWLSGCFGVMALYIVIQTVPLGAILPPLVPPGASSAISAATISLTPGDTLLAFTRWITYGLLFFFAAQTAAHGKRAYRLFSGLFWVVVVHALLGLILLFGLGDTLFGIPKSSYLGSATGGFVNRNSFATFLSIGAVIGASLLLERSVFPHGPIDPKHSRFDRYFERGGILQIAIGWLTIIATLVATNSRMGVAAGAVGLCLVLLLSLIRLPRQSGRLPVVATATGGVMAVVLLFFLYGQTLIERLGNAGRDQTVRLHLYRQVLEMIHARPLLGYGGDSFETVYPLFHDFPVSINFVWDKTHNTYLSNWVDYGILFGSLPLVICLSVVVRLLKDFVRMPRPDMVVVSTLGALTVVAVHSLADFSLEIEGVTALFVLVCGAGYARATSRLVQAEEV